MNSALQRIFWGYFFIFFRIHIGFDLLMDPVGYFLIYSGCSKIVKAYPQAKKPIIVALVGMVLSIPSVIVNLSDTTLAYSWTVYSTGLFILKIIIAFYLFMIFTEIVNVFGNPSLIVRTRNTFKYYIGFHPFALALMSFYMNVSGDGWIVLNVISTIGILLMDILFLFLIGAIRKVTPDSLRSNYFV